MKNIPHGKTCFAAWDYPLNHRFHRLNRHLPHSFTNYIKCFGKFHDISCNNHIMKNIGSILTIFQVPFVCLTIMPFGDNDGYSGSNSHNALLLIQDSRSCLCPTRCGDSPLYIFCICYTFPDADVCNSFKKAVQSKAIFCWRFLSNSKNL